MSDISRLLSMGRGALMSQQQRMEVSQHNIANASTEGYVRQRVDMVTLGGQYGGKVRGVTTEGPYAVRTPFYERQIAFQRSEVGFHNQVGQIGRSLETSLFPDGEAKTAVQVGGFFDAMGALSSQPADPARRRDVLSKAETVAASFRQDANVLTREMTSIEATARDSVESLNKDLGQIAKLDQQIREAVASGGGDDLIDERNRIVGRVTDQLNVQVVNGKDGTVQLVTNDGRSIVEGGQARTLSLQKNNNELSLSLSGVSGDQPIAQPGGSLGGLVSGHNDVALGALNDLNTRAEEFANAMNAAHSAGFGVDGVNGRNLFSITPGAGAAASFAVDAAVSGNPDALATSGTGAQGDNASLRAMMDVRDTNLPSGGQIEDGIRSIQQRIGTTIADADRNAITSDSSLQQLSAMKSSVEGVSMEEEILNLTQAQRGFEAAMKVLQASESMFDSIMSLKS